MRRKPLKTASEEQIAELGRVLRAAIRVWGGYHNVQVDSRQGSLVNACISAVNLTYDQAKYGPAGRLAEELGIKRRWRKGGHS